MTWQLIFGPLVVVSRFKLILFRCYLLRPVKSFLVSIDHFSLCGFPPFYGDSQKELFENIMSGTFDFPDPEWTDVSDEGLVHSLHYNVSPAKDFIKKILVVDPEKRYTAEQCLAHPFIKVRPV